MCFSGNKKSIGKIILSTFFLPKILTPKYTLCHGGPCILIASYFEDYAKVAFEAFGDRVKNWITINEPWVIAVSGYGTGDFAPGIYGPGIYDYQAGHNLIRAHAKAYRLYHKKFQNAQNGM